MGKQGFDFPVWGAISNAFFQKNGVSSSAVYCVMGKVPNLKKMTSLEVGSLSNDLKD